MPNRARSRQNPQGELRRRWELLWEAGCFVRLGAQGLRMALWVHRKANWSTGEIFVSVRQIARQMGSAPSTVQRGINELVEEGVIELVRGGGPGRSSVYVVPNRAPVRNSSAPEVGTLVPGGRVQAHRRAGTTAPPLGTNRAPVGNKPRQHMEHIAINSIGIQLYTNGVINAETDGGGREPPPRLREHRRIRRDHDGDGPPAADQASATGT
jgi:hypothetical protein